MNKVKPSDVYRLMQIMGMSEVELADRGLVEFLTHPSLGIIATTKGKTLLEAVDNQIAQIMKPDIFEGEELHLVDGEFEDTAF